MISISVVIITMTNGTSPCLDSVRKLADEVIVLDAYSTDNTAEIAKSRDAVVKLAFF